MSFDPNAFNVTVRRVIIDERAVFEARVLELPDVRGYGDSASDAYEQAVEAVAALHDAAEADHEDFPAAIEPEMEFSGRVTLRMPKSLHRIVALRAQEEDISINSYIVNSLAISLSALVSTAVGSTETFISPGSITFGQTFVSGGSATFGQTSVCGGYGDYAQAFIEGLDPLSAMGFSSGAAFNRYSCASLGVAATGATVTIVDVSGSEDAVISAPLLPHPIAHRRTKARRPA